MNVIIFWGVIGLLTLAACGCIWWPLRSKKAWWAAGFPVLALGVYLIFGGSAQLQQFWSQQQRNAEIQQQIAEIKNPQELIARMRAHLRQAPGSAQGWLLLGKLYLDQRQYADAEAALTEAHRLQPHSADTVLTLAKANFFRHQGHLTPAMEASLVSVLESLTEPVEALNLLAVNSYQRKDFSLAVSYWQRALALVQPDSPDSRTLLNMISDAQRQEGVKHGRKH